MLTEAVSAPNVGIQKKIYESGMIKLMILNEETKDIMKIVKSLEESGLSIKHVSETIEDKAKEQKCWFPSM